MNIALFTYEYLPKRGGAEVFTYNLGEELMRRGHDVTLYLPREKVRSFAESGIEHSVRVRPIWVLEGSFLKRWPRVLSWALRREQEKNGYDVWQIVGAYPAGYLAKELALTVPVVLRAHGIDIQKDDGLQYGLRLNPAMEEEIGDTVQRMTRLAALTQTVKDCYLELGAAEEKISIIPNGVDLRRFDRESCRDEIRDQLEVGVDETMLLTVGRYHVKKGYEQAIEALSILAGRGYNVKWVMVGDGLDRLNGLAEEKDVSGRLILRSESDIVSGVSGSAVGMPSGAIIDMYKAADIFVMPSILETFGMVLIEAMAAGLPVVTTDAPGCRDVVRDCVTGLHAKAGDAGSIADSIGRIMDDDELRNGLMVNAAADIARYEWSEVTRQYEELYHALGGNQ